MFRTMRPFGAGVMLMALIGSLMAVSACNGPSVPIPVPTPFTPVAITPVPVSGPTLAESSNVALSIINAMPAQIGRFTLSKDPKLTYVGTVHNMVTGEDIIAGDRITYTTSTGAQLVFAIWIGQNANYPVDRWQVELSYQTPGLQVIPVEIGDQAVVIPTNKGRDNNFAYNPALWGIVRYRNILIDLDPSKDLTDQTSTTQDEVMQLLQTAFNAIPK
jgi:hypothetical protein